MTLLSDWKERSEICLEKEGSYKDLYLGEVKLVWKSFPGREWFECMSARQGQDRGCLKSLSGQEAHFDVGSRNLASGCMGCSAFY